MNILVGADPEFFVKQNGVFVSAHGLVSGTKQNPLKVNKGAVQVDGHALEFNIDPAANAEDFYVNITTVLSALKDMCPKHEHVIEPVAHFTHDYLKSMPAEANELGCEPDFNGWTGEINPKPDQDLPMRTAAGHIHIGFTDVEDPNQFPHPLMMGDVARQLDFFLGLPSLMFDDDKLRREMYGKAGCFRPKKYGLEYRTLSNAWLKSESLIKWAFTNAKEGVEQFFAGNLLFNKYGDIQDIINNSDKDKALEICRKENINICVG